MRVISWVPSPFAVEAITVLHGLRLALNMGFRSVTLEGDSNSVFNKILANGIYLSEIRALTWEVKELAKSFQICTFRSVDL